MSNTIHALAQQLTGKASVEECDIEDLKEISRRYPYFAAAQFLLVQKLKQIDSPDFESQTRQAILFFPDPILFDIFISSDKFYNDSEVGESKAALQALTDNPNKILNDNKDEASNEELLACESPLKNSEASPESTPDDDKEQGPEMPSLKTAFIEEQIDEAETSKYISSNSLEHLEVNDKDIQNRNLENIIGDNTNIITLPINIKAKEVAETDEQRITSNPPKNELLFEPYHSVDYFASQGIKVSQEGLPNDKLGKQLKSFTDWLKTMKQLPAVQITEQVEMIAEKKIENMASRSVSESSVITEAMAEVWAKQGNKEKAAETYNKLSLLNPSKKAFFAAKIENLKTF